MAFDLLDGVGDGGADGDQVREVLAQLRLDDDGHLPGVSVFLGALCFLTGTGFFGCMVAHVADGLGGGSGGAASRCGLGGAAVGKRLGSSQALPVVLVSQPAVWRRPARS